MMKMALLAILFGGLAAGAAMAGAGFEQDIIATSQGDLKITFIGHATLMFEFAGKVIHVDPVGSEADYTKLPKADIILVTHEHGDHLDLRAIGLLKKPTSDLLLTGKCAEKTKEGGIIKNGQSILKQGIKRFAN